MVEIIRQAFKLLDRPAGDWPFLLCVLCAAIIGFLGLWYLANSIGSARDGASTDTKDTPTAASGEPKNPGHER
jgi:hypothetical protein